MPLECRRAHREVVEESIPLPLKTRSKSEMILIPPRLKEMERAHGRRNFPLNTVNGHKYLLPETTIPPAADPENQERRPESFIFVPLPPPSHPSSLWYCICTLVVIVSVCRFYYGCS